jgi:uncharacterized protein (DUF58 family)
VVRVVAAGVLLILVGLTFDAGVLFVPGGALVALGLAVPPWIRLAAIRASVRRELHADRVVEEQPLEATIEVRRGPLGLPGGQVLDAFAGGAMTLSRRGPGGGAARTSVWVVARFPRRGRLRFDPPSLSLHDPLGLVRIRRPGEGPIEELLVLPRTERIRWLTEDLGRQPESPALRSAIEAFAANEVDGLRPYRPGAPASRIHWAALARGAGLLERRLLPDAGSGPLVVLDARSSGPRHLDAAVRAAASLTLELARGTGCELLLPGERRPLFVGSDLASWPGAHARLALVEGGPDQPPPALGSRPRAGTTYHVVAEAADEARRLPVERRLGAVLVIPAELAREVRYPALFDVAGCRAFALDAGQRRERAA